MSDRGSQPAYPFSQVQEVYKPTQHTGLSVRERFVMAALSGPSVGELATEPSSKAYAAAAVQLADDALAAMEGRRA